MKSTAESSGITIQTEGPRALNVLLKKPSNASWRRKRMRLLFFCIVFRHAGEQASYVSLIVEGVVLVLQPQPLPKLWGDGRISQYCNILTMCALIFYFLCCFPELSVLESSPDTPAWPQTPGAAAGNQGWGLRRVAPPWQQPALPASPSPSPSWCKPPPEWHCEKCRPNCGTKWKGWVISIGGSV